MPSVMYGQLIAYYATWRWIGLICALWAFIGLVMTAMFYFPPPRVNSQGLSRREILQQIDYVGGILSVAGMLLFMMVRRIGGEEVSVSKPFADYPCLPCFRACSGVDINTNGVQHTSWCH